jgi:hypothetical protein
VFQECYRSVSGVLFGCNRRITDKRQKIQRFSLKMDDNDNWEDSSEVPGKQSITVIGFQLAQKLHINHAMRHIESPHGA